MESLLERGEKLDDLVAKSEVLGQHSKHFYKTVSGSARPPNKHEMGVARAEGQLCAAPGQRLA